MRSLLRKLLSRRLPSSPPLSPLLFPFFFLFPPLAVCRITLSMFPRILNATPEERNRWRLTARRRGIHGRTSTSSSPPSLPFFLFPFFFSLVVRRWLPRGRYGKDRSGNRHNARHFPHFDLLVCPPPFFHLPFLFFSPPFFSPPPLMASTTRRPN